MKQMHMPILHGLPICADLGQTASTCMSLDLCAFPWVLTKVVPGQLVARHFVADNLSQNIILVLLKISNGDSFFHLSNILFINPASTSATLFSSIPHSHFHSNNILFINPASISATFILSIPLPFKQHLTVFKMCLQQDYIIWLRCLVCWVIYLINSPIWV